MSESARPRGVTAKLVLLLRELAAGREPAGVSHLARSTGLPKTTVHRLLADLESNGIVHRDQGRYQLASRPHWANPGPQRDVTLRKVVKPYLLELYARTGHVVTLATACGDMARFLDVLYPHRFTEILLRTTAAVPLHCTATGKAMLAFDPATAEQYLRKHHLTRLTRHSIGTRQALDAALVETRLRGVAIDHQEHVAGFWGVAAPLVDTSGRAVGAIGLAGPVRGFRPGEHVAQLRTVAKAASDAHNRRSPQTVPDGGTAPFQDPEHCTASPPGVPKPP
ncbi:IclR family transcriptional regulator [Glycomyces tritici]|uniref:IclR family transcriptional regulator n=1 Tax=Glycomyces tritici TaxID=2665176 RepID=A0ABT7YWQ6_9ACTN|nr:IclR family transcriptional regulator [Glycomyces tritici]MDN3243081.1 IclR family transcriptional regulator [Glycomyces tritici]